MPQNKIASILVLFISAILLSGPFAGCKIRPAEKRTSPALVTFSECDRLEYRLKENLKQEMRESLLYYDDMYLYGPVADVTGPVPGDATGESAFTDTAGWQAGVDYSGTNNQETGVDEADFVKTDGYCLFVVNGNKLFILPVEQFGSLASGDTVEIEGTPFNMLLYKNDTGSRAARALVFSTVYAGDLKPDHPLYPYLAGSASGGNSFYATHLTKLTLIDVSVSPQVVRQLYYDGSYQAARLIGSSAHVALYARPELPGLMYWPELPASYYEAANNPIRKALWNGAVAKTIAKNELYIDSLSLEDLVPRIYELAEGAIQPHATAAGTCGNFSIADDGDSRGFTTLVSFDISVDKPTIDDDHIVTNWGEVYASADSLFIAEPSNGQWWYRANTDYEETTNIHKFSLAAGSAAYIGSGRIDGSINNQFSLSEYGGALRIAATTNSWSRWWISDQEKPESHVFILRTADDGSLQTVGHVGGIAQGERIWACRFIGARGFLVTFRNIDPLWTVDLSDESVPKIMGELEVPGVATYIHPVAQDRLLTIGYGGDESGLDGSVQVSLFDVADFAHPRLIDDMTLSLPAGDTSSSSWYTSQALYEHKAFQYWAPLSLLAVPLSGSTSTWDENGNGSHAYISKLILLKVDPDKGITSHGEIDHSAFYNDDSAWYWGNQDISRSVFMGNYIYALSDKAVTASDLATMTQTTAVKLPGSGYSYWGGFTDSGAPPK